MKYLVFVLNLTLIIAGVTLLGFGIHVYANMSFHRPIMGDDYYNVSLALMILGLSTLVVALLGCVASWKEYVYVIIINAVCYSVLTLGLIGVVAWLIVQKVRQGIYNLTGKIEIEGKSRQNAENKQTFHLTEKIEIEGKSRQNAENKLFT